MLSPSARVGIGRTYVARQVLSVFYITCTLFPFFKQFFGDEQQLGRAARGSFLCRSCLRQLASGMKNPVNDLRSNRLPNDIDLNLSRDVCNLQDLELWLGKEKVDGHYDVVARAGSKIQELQVYGSLSMEELKGLIDKVMSA
jgi:hypothetical protein